MKYLIHFSLHSNYDMHSRLCDYSFGITLAVYMRINMDKPYPFSKVY